MGYGINFTADIFLSRMSFASKMEVDDKIKELEKDNVDIEKKVLMFVAANPKDLRPEDWDEDGVMFLFREVENLFEMYKENLSSLSKLYLFSEYLETHEMPSVQ